ncbi:MAG: Transcriptional regulator, AcrR family, partial [uncultured Rubrobacteraceae bacterium]
DGTKQARRGRGPPGVGEAGAREPPGAQPSKPGEDRARGRGDRRRGRPGRGLPAQGRGLARRRADAVVRLRCEQGGVARAHGGRGIRGDGVRRADRRGLARRPQDHRPR